MNHSSVLRIRIILATFCFVALIIISKLYWIQIIKFDDYREKANVQYESPSFKEYDRGSIFFELKDGTKIGAATIKEGYTLAINPKILEDIEIVYNTLSSYIKIDKESFINKANKKDDPYEEIIKKLDKETGESIKALRIKGVIVSNEFWRVYPAESLASQSVGITGYNDNNKIVGRYGLERYYEEILSRNDSVLNRNVFAEIFNTIRDSVFNSENREGDIVSTIEPSVNSFLEKTISNIQDKWNSDSIGGIIMDPNNGKIYAISSYPTFNANNLKDIKDPKVFSNPIVENVYEMGSIIKPLTIAAGLDTEAIDMSFTYIDNGTLEFSGKKISNFDKKVRGKTTLQELLSNSLNIGAATVATEIGKDNFIEYFKKYGFGSITGIDQPNEQKSIIKNLESKRDIEIATASYGQGIALSPIATIRALSTLANGGKLITPHLVSRFEYSDGNIEQLEPPEEQILKKESVDNVTKLLVNLVDNTLRNGSVKMNHYSIAAKTGTAQIADKVNGGYYKDRYLHSFFGYFPAYNPRFIVFLYHINPKNADFASETLTDPFIQITKFLINYYELPPDR